MLDNWNLAQQSRFTHHYDRWCQEWPCLPSFGKKTINGLKKGTSRMFCSFWSLKNKQALKFYTQVKKSYMRKSIFIHIHDVTWELTWPNYYRNQGEYLCFFEQHLTVWSEGPTRWTFSYGSESTDLFVDSGVRSLQGTPNGVLQLERGPALSREVFHEVPHVLVISF